MKKLLGFFVTVVLTIACAFGVAGCKNSSGGKLSVFVPDGAPALSVATLADSDKFDVHVIDANTIASKVTGAKPEADIAIMPVNAAVKMLGNGKNYQMLGTVTHGNLFLMKQSGQEDVSAPADLNKLVGKTVGVINLANVPGLTFKTILRDNNIAYNELGDDGSVAADKVNLTNVTKLQVVPATASCQYFVVSEPVATAKATATPLSIAGSLQTLYGGENGYPQAVAVAKKSVIESKPNEIAAFMNSFAQTQSWLTDENTTGAQIAAAVDKMTDGDLAHAFNANDLTKSVISNCGINFVPSAQCKDEVKSFMQKFNTVSNNAWGTSDDSFFYEKI